MNRRLPISKFNGDDQSYIKTYWRPAVAWSYLAVCVFDFIVAPTAYALLQALMHMDKIEMWDPLTLRGAGLYHMSMAAIVGVTAWGRSQEKIDAAILQPPGGQPQ